MNRVCSVEHLKEWVDMLEIGPDKAVSGVPCEFAAARKKIAAAAYN